MMNMFGAGGFPCSLPLCQQPIMCPYDVPVPQPCPCPYPVPQPYIQNFCQPVDVPIQNTIQPVIVPQPFCVPVPQPVAVPVERPCPVPVPQPVCVPVDRPCPCPCPVPFLQPVCIPVDRPCPVPVPVCVPVPQPCAVPQPICIPVPVPQPVPVPVPQPMRFRIQEEFYAPQQEYIYEEPICIKRRHRHHHHHHHHRHHRSCTPMPPLPPIIIPIPIQGPSFAQEQPLQVTEYVQDIYPPAQVFNDQVPVGYIANNSVCQQPAQIQNQQSLNCQPGMILPATQCIESQQLLQQLPSGQFVGRPLSVGGGGGVQNIISSPQSFLSPSNSAGLMNSCFSGAQMIS